MDITEFTNTIVQAVYGSIDDMIIATVPFVIAGLGVCVVKVVLNKIADFFTGKLN